MSPELPEILAVTFQIIDILDELGVRYHLGGSYAGAVHGVPRHIQGIDFVAALGEADVPPLLAALDPSFYVDAERIAKAVRTQSSAQLVHRSSGIMIYLFVRGGNAFDREELSRSQEIEVGERRIQVKSPEDTLLRKLQWYRSSGEISDRQWGDLQGLVATQRGRLDKEYVAKWAKVLEVEDLLQRLLGENG